MMARSLLSLILFSFIGLTVGCDDGWSQFGDNCYYVDQNTVDFWSAQDACQSNNAELTSILSQDENDFLDTLLEDDAWIGLYMIDFDVYGWTDGSTVSLENWATGQPDDKYGAEKCVVMNERAGAWSDQNCGFAYPYVCKERMGDQAPATLTSLIQGKCPEGFISEEFSNKCYKIFGGDGDALGDLRWEEAYEECLDQDAEFASITSAAEQSFVLLLMEDISSDVWIGLGETLSTNIWMDNSALDYAYYAPYDEATEDYECFAIDRKTELLGQWIRADCDFEFMYLCQAERVPDTDLDPPTFEDEYTDPACSDGYFRYHGYCYKFYEEEKSWDEASDACIQDGGQLAITVDLFEVARFTYESAKNGVTKDAWIGVQYEKSTGAFTWGDDYLIWDTFWAIGEPDMDEDELCVSVNNMAWYDTDCNTQLPFFCVIGDVSDLIEPVPTSNGGTCENPGDMLWGDWCYYVSPDGDYYWADANQNCQNLGQQLASIHSKAENDAIEKYVDQVRPSGGLWIGLQRTSRSEGSFFWSDASSFNFALWNPGEPNNNNEECVEFQGDGEWNDLYCNDYMRGYICKGDKIPLATTIVTTTAATTTGTKTISRATTKDVDEDDDNTASLDSATGLSGGALAGTIIAAIIIVIVVAVVAFLTVTKRWTALTGRFSNSGPAYSDKVCFADDKVNI